jgi:hypothetical protein
MLYGSLDIALSYLLRYCIVLGLFLNSMTCGAQSEVDDFSDILEQVIQDLEQDGDFDYDAVFDRLAVYLAHPADLNTGDLQELVGMGLLTDTHVFALQSHIRAVGPLISVYELQSIPGFDLDVIRRIMPFITTGGNLWDSKQPLKELILKGDNQIFVRWSRT